VLAAADSFGRYQIVRLLGRGAMGAVYLAYDTQLQRHVALKTPFLGGNPQIIERFYREARSAAQLRSPYICQIFDVGEISGIHYMSMAFISGVPLTKMLAEGRLQGTKDIVEITRKVARGIQKAHEHGIIHRDLKPDNIMIDSDGEPVVMDFGLARRVDDDAMLTSAGSLLGTPAYMSPEQVDGDPRKIGPATDIYSLGVILFQLSTGRLPFQGSITAILRQISTDQPPRPSAIATTVAPGSRLEQICLKMMAKPVADRYASMAEVIKALDDVYSAGTPAVGGAKEKRSWWNRLFGLGSKPQPASSHPTPPPSTDSKQAKPSDSSLSSATPTVDLPDGQS
jgi:serine/threonine protein kinase